LYNLTGTTETVTINKIDVSETLKNVENLLKEDKTASPQMRAMIELLVVIINLFVAKFGLNSKNSSIPPSKDPRRKRGAKNKSKGEKKKPGGQKGHNGSTLKKVLIFKLFRPSFIRLFRTISLSL